MHHRKETVAYDEWDFEENGDFHVTPDEHGMTVDGPGTLDSLLVVCESDNFGVRVETDKTTLVDADYADLESHTSDLAHISAYQNSNGEYVIAVNDFSFLKWVRAAVTVTGSAEFDWVRAVYTLEA